MAKLSDAEKLTAEWIAEQTRTYGPLNEAQVRQFAETYRANGSDRWHGRANRTLAYGLTNIANEMEPGEVVTGAVPWWKRF